MSKKTCKTKTDVINDEEESRFAAVLSEINFHNHEAGVTVGTLSALYNSKYGKAPDYNKIRNLMEHIKRKPDRTDETMETDFFVSSPSDGAAETTCLPDFTAKTSSGIETGAEEIFTYANVLELARARTIENMVEELTFLWEIWQKLITFRKFDILPELAKIIVDMMEQDGKFRNDCQTQRDWLEGFNLTGTEIDTAELRESMKPLQSACKKCHENFSGAKNKNPVVDPEYIEELYKGIGSRTILINPD